MMGLEPTTFCIAKASGDPPLRRGVRDAQIHVQAGRWFVLGAVVGAVLATGAAATIAAIPDCSP
jgi:hypothetical protein